MVESTVLSSSSRDTKVSNNPLHTGFSEFQFPPDHQAKPWDDDNIYLCMYLEIAQLQNPQCIETNKLYIG